METSPDLLRSQALTSRRHGAIADLSPDQFCPSVQANLRPWRELSTAAPLMAAFLLKIDEGSKEDAASIAHVPLFSLLR
jgi:hypothetical protein